MNIDLKPCPHCGGEAYLERAHRAFINAQATRVAFVRCTVCNARSGRYKLEKDGVPDHPAEARRMAVEAWNRRAE